MRTLVFGMCERVIFTHTNSARLHMLANIFNDRSKYIYDGKGSEQQWR